MKTECSDLIQAAMASDDLDQLLLVLESAERQADVNNIVTVAEKSVTEKNQGTYDYLLAQISFDRGDAENAIKRFVSAADNGRYSGYFRAAHIITTLSGEPYLSCSKEPLELVKKGADLGHVFSRSWVLSCKSRSGKIWNKIVYIGFRLFWGPMLILYYSRKAKGAEQIRV